MATTLLIKATDITKATPMGGNIDVNKYLHVIKESQVFVIEPVLGTKLYKKLLTDYKAGTIEGVYQEMLEDYIQPILTYSVAAEFILIHAFNVANGGIFKHQPENSEAVSKSEVDFLVQNQRSKAEAYIQRLQKYLCDTNIPEYRSSQDNNYDMNPDSTMSYTGGWKLS